MKRDYFEDPRFPGLKINRIAHDNYYGRMELESIEETSDGFLLGWCKIGEGEDSYHHSVFLGRAADFRK